MTIKPILFGAAAAIAASLSFGANAAVVTADMTLTDDRSFQDGDGDGTADALLVQNDVYLRTFGVNSFWRSAIEFDMSSISMGSTISSAILSLRDNGTSSDGRIDVYGYTADGIITLADGSELANLVTSFIVTEANGTEDFDLDVTSLLVSLLAANANFAGFLLVSESNQFGIGGSDICSSEASNGTANFVLPECVGAGPRLSVTYDTGAAAVPLPAALPLFAGGLLAGFGARARKRRTA